ncbi:MAG: 2'-5' RNA ligase family protein [Bacteroidota bacterium]|mgnify:CR=1 FL=1
MAVSKELSLYFIALIPPEPFRQNSWRWKEYFRDQYQSKASLNSPPHITLHMPFKLKTKREVELVEKLQDFSRIFSPFVVELESFGAFPPRVIFVDVIKSAELENLQQTINRQMKEEFQIFNANYQDRPFRPHLTLAFRDLKKAQFCEAWAEFQHKEVRYTWEASHFSLLKHDGRRWQTWQDISLGE